MVGCSFGQSASAVAAASKENADAIVLEKHPPARIRVFIITFRVECPGARGQRSDALAQGKTLFVPRNGGDEATVGS